MGCNPLRGEKIFEIVRRGLRPSAGVAESGVVESGRSLAQAYPQFRLALQDHLSYQMILVVDSAKTGLPGEDHCDVGWQWNLSITDDKKLEPQGSLSVRFTRLLRGLC